MGRKRRLAGPIWFGKWSTLIYVANLLIVFSGPDSEVSDGKTKVHLIRSRHDSLAGPSASSNIGGQFSDKSSVSSPLETSIRKSELELE